MISNAKIYGLVLSGGKSTRMGQDKGLITYHGIPQRDHLYKILDEVCDRTYLSIRKDQKEAIAAEFNTIVDRNEYRGPYNGLLSAHKAFPDVAWLVLACDLPLIDREGNGTCPRKFLINNEVKLVFPKRKEVLLNANSKLEYETALEKLSYD